MYCSTCGVAVAQGLSYCKNCGAKLNRDDSDAAAQVRPELLVTSMVALFIFGLAGITVLVGVLKAVLHLSPTEIFPIALFCCLILLALEGVFIRLLFRRTGGAGATNERALTNEQVTNELGPGAARVLAEPMASVTEHTTRAFEPLRSDRK